MSASHLEFHVEERSMEAFLNAWLSRFLPMGCDFRVLSYAVKPALLRKIGSRLKGYSKWMPPDCRIVIVVDCDQDDCKELKARLESICRQAGLESRRAAMGADWQVVTRIVIEELDAWYFGDWSAVRTAYPRVSSNIPRRSICRDPDAIRGGTWEAFQKILRNHGYFKQGLAKADAAAAIGENFNPDLNKSHSFSVFRDAIVEAAT